MNVALENELTKMFSELEPKAQTLVVELVKILHINKKTEDETKPKKKRIAGLHQGQGWISDDFNDELGDEFWFGEDFGIIKKTMNLLLDTHIFIWWEIEMYRLSAERLRMLEDENNHLFLSLASIWEIQLKIMLNKFKLPKPLPEIIRGQQTVNDLQILPITPKHIYELENLPFHHKDPFDRLLIAQAIVEDFTLVTNDPKFSDYSVKLI